MDKRLQIAISKAKAGYELSARDLFIDIVEDDPDNKMAWLWLIGLLDEREDLIIACENVLRIDPSEERVRIRLEKLRRVDKMEKARQEKAALAKIDYLLQRGNKELALTRLRKIVQNYNEAEDAWILLAKHTPDLNERVKALTQILALDPHNEEKRAALRRVRYFRSNPLELAANHEERGEIDEAIAIYEQLTVKAKGRSEWDRIFRQIRRLESLKAESIVHISSKLTLARLSLGLPLLFFFIVIIQTGYDFRYFTFLMGIEFVMVILGAFLMAISSISVEHRLWEFLGNAAGRGSKRLRLTIGAMGFTITFSAFLLLSIEAYARWSTVFDYVGYGN